MTDNAADGRTITEIQMGAAAAKPLPLKLLRKVAAPAEQQDFAQPVAEGDQGGHQGDIQQIFANQCGHGSAVEGGERIVKCFVPIGNQHADAHDGERTADHGSQKQPFAPLAFGKPKRGGKTEETAEGFHEAT